MDTKQIKKKLPKVGRRTIAEALVHTEGLTQTQAEKVVKLVFDEVLYQVLEQKIVDIPGFGKFFGKYTPPRLGSHPQTHETIEIGPTVQMRAEFSSNVKKQLNNYVDRFQEVLNDGTEESKPLGRDQ
ncbi:MAG: HU family DNA-binding protein [Halobacteria archaeon]